MVRVGVFGWGIVAPTAPNMNAFAERLDAAGNWLTPFDGFGPSNFLVGEPEFDFEDYRSWIDERFPPNRFPALQKKMGLPTQYAVGAYIQALRQNPALEGELRDLGREAICIVGGGLHDLPTYYQASLDYARTERTWHRFWASPEHNDRYSAHLEQVAAGATPPEDMPPTPDSVDLAERDLAEDAYWKYWAARSPQLATYLEELRAIEAVGVDGDVESGKAAAMRRKQGAILKLQKKWQIPTPPWNGVTPNVLWNIGNTPASQISMMGKITGMCFAPFAACSTFGYALKLGMDSIRSGQAKVAVIGATDPPPHAMSVGTFYNARVLAADGQVSKPLTEMKGTHVAGGSVVWIIGDLDYLVSRGCRPVGMEPVAVGLTADADHIITPSVEGPVSAIEAALAEAKIDAKEIRQWDLHATATPGDYLEVETARKLLSSDVAITARKGTFGHGMGAGGGWELTAQYLGYERGRVAPTALTRDELHSEIAKVHGEFVFNDSDLPSEGWAGKLSMGVGGINACVISRPLEPTDGTA